MKNVVLVLLAALVSIGFAAAWDYTDNLYYQYSKTGYVQGGDPVPALVGAVSGTWFESDNQPWETEASFANELTSAKANYDLIDGKVQSGHATLTQIGGATVTIRAPDLADGLPMQDASFYTKQNMHFGPAIFVPGASGLTGDRSADMVFANFRSEGSVGVNNLEVGSRTETEKAGGLANDQYDAIGAIEGTAGTSIQGADIGVGSTTGFTKDELGNVLISGSTTAFAGFTGGKEPLGAGNFLQSNTGMYETSILSQNADFPSLGAEPALVSGGEFANGYPDY